ncbi:MAG TPA: M56 family metallopeptidase [Steroidobacteraceae bacterium]|nr:M56 family metallopeptidase [Steroidobacteraceae bacterium]
MWQVMIYANAVALALSLVGHCEERLAAMGKLARRYIWPLTMVLSLSWAAAGVLWWGKATPATPASFAAAPALQLASAAQEGGRLETDSTVVVDDSATVVPVTTPVWSPPSDRTLLAVWAAASGLLLLYLVGANSQLRRRAARWQRAVVLGRDVLVSEAVGPALLGAWRPRIVVPGWFLTEPSATQALILHHEGQHISARDPLLLRLALLVAVIVPWNLPLWWQLKRLRHSIELDCDARVLRDGAAPAAYGEVLLAVTRRSSNIPSGLVAMGTPVSALERRIGNLAAAPARHSLVRAAVALLFGALGIGAAIGLEAPPSPLNTTANLPRLLPPDLGNRSGPRGVILRALAGQHPELMNGPALDSQAIVSLTLRADGSVESSELRRVEPGDLASRDLANSIATRPMGSAAGIMSFARGEAMPDGTTLTSRLIVSYAVRPANYDPTRSVERVHQAMLAAHPELLLPLNADTFNRVTVYMTEDGRIDRHAVELRRREDLRPYGDIEPANFGRLWQPLGLEPEQLGTMGITNISQSRMRTETAPDGTVRQIAEPPMGMIVRYAWPRRPGEPMGGTPSSPAAEGLSNLVSFTHTDAARVVEHHLPNALNDQGTSTEGTPWLVLSRDGQVVRSGYLSPQPERALTMARLQAELPDLKLAESFPMTVVKQYAVSYSYSVLLAWLAPETGIETTRP